MSSQILIRIVDDDCAMREALSFLLENEGWTVAAYGSAEEFLINDAPSQAGCLVLDIKMDGMSGVELQAEMLRRGYNIPIIFLTGHGTIDMAVRAVQRGALDFLQKPLDNARFLEAVKKAGFFSLFPLAFLKFPWVFLKSFDFGFWFLSFWLDLPGLNQPRPEAEGNLGRGRRFLPHDLFTFFTH